VDSFGLSIRTAQPEVRPAYRDGPLGLTLQTCALEPSMAIIAIFDQPGMTQAQYEQVADKVNHGRGMVKSLTDWPVPGLLSHTSARTPNGWFVADVWESEEAFRRFSEVVLPLLREAGAPEVEPKIYPVFNLVTP
jgi:hypothetical protein